MTAPLQWTKGLGSPVSANAGPGPTGGCSTAEARVEPTSDEVAGTGAPTTGRRTVNKYLDWASHEYPLRWRLVVLFVLGTLFLGLFPLLLVRGSARLDRRLRLRRFRAGIINPIAGVGLGLAGAFFALSSIRAQVETGSGTPLPIMPTQRLVVKPPFTYCRNPMTLGTILGYGGVGVWLGSISAVGIVAVVGALLLVYVRFVEEKELEARFGPAYLEYKRTAPFLLPRMRRRPGEPPQ
jgi:protein-S-isoprenylcysteine O-methyltransferase Ste14